MTGPATKPHPTSSPQTLEIPFNKAWQIVRPRVYRFLPSVYVDAFFADGSLRLSSFKKFAQHTDEQRRDTSEGFGMRVGSGEDRTNFVVGGKGSNSYVLCGSTVDSSNVASKFPDCDACFVIDDILNFANAVAFQLPYFIGGVEGAAIYQDDTTIFKDVGSATNAEVEEKYRLPDGNIDMQIIFDTYKQLGGVEEYFVKHSRYADQSEYRLLWMSNKEVDEYIDIKVPDALQFCRRVR